MIELLVTAFIEDLGFPVWGPYSFCFSNFTFRIIRVFQKKKISARILSTFENLGKGKDTDEDVSEENKERTLSTECHKT
jgi:hypothetical protein